MAPHWSGVEVGEYFDFTITYDAAVYCEETVVIPFQRREADGLPTCLREGIDFTVKSVNGDSAYHIQKALRCNLQGAPPPERGSQEA